MKYYLKPLVVTVLFLLCFAVMTNAYVMRDSSLDSYQEPNYEALRQYLMSTRKQLPGQLPGTELRSIPAVLDVNKETVPWTANKNLRQYLMSTRKRSCIRRGSSCDHRPGDCCFNSSCRCNLWGTNCRCQRAGLFQKWGK